jgi:hypothetical protein
LAPLRPVYTFFILSLPIGLIFSSDRDHSRTILRRSPAMVNYYSVAEPPEQVVLGSRALIESGELTGINAVLSPSR